MNWNKKTLGTLLTTLVALIVISPLADIAVTALFGTALFGFGSIAFYILMTASSAVSVAFWLRRKHAKQTFPNKRLFS